MAPFLTLVIADYGYLVGNSSHINTRRLLLSSTTTYSSPHYRYLVIVVSRPSFISRLLYYLRIYY